MFEELSGKISALPAQSPARDVEKNLRVLLNILFARTDLETRAEFEVLARLLDAVHWSPTLHMKLHERPRRSYFRD